jgi:hypothetical protein
MPAFQFEKEMNLQVKARLIPAGGAPSFNSRGCKVRLFDRDFLEDEYLAESLPDAEGNVEFIFPFSAMNQGVLDDKMPDFFFVIYNAGGEVIHQSEAMQNVNIEAIENYVHGVGAVVNLGSFLVNA